MAYFLSGNSGGTFTGTGNTIRLNLREDIDWIEVHNFTNSGATGNDSTMFYWQRGMADGTGIRWFKDGGGNNLNQTNLATPNGFFPIDEGVLTVTVSPNEITNISAAATPRVTSVAHGLQTGDIINIHSATGAAQLGGVDFRVTRVDADNFDLTWMAQVIAAAAPGSNSRIRKVSREGIYIPKSRRITAITAASQAVVTFSAPHDFTVGQQVRFKIPRVTSLAFGMTELDGLVGNVVAISTANNTITVDVDTSGFTAFAFPLTADVPLTFAEALPVGQDTATVLSVPGVELDDATRNIAIIGMDLAGGADSPGGASSDVLFWKAGVFCRTVNPS